MLSMLHFISGRDVLFFIVKDIVHFFVKIGIKNISVRSMIFDLVVYPVNRSI